MVVRFSDEKGRMNTMYTPIMYQRKLKYPISGHPNNVEIDVVRDFEKICGRILQKLDIKRKNINDSSMDYYRLMHRLIENKPRKIMKAISFSCPVEYERALKLIERIIQCGENLHPFMTRNLKRLQYEDLLLSDWGIYHLHLSEEIDPRDGFMQRSDKLLMVRIEDKTVYFIAVVDHNLKNVWSLKRYIEIIKANWPETIERYRMNEMHLLEKLSDDDYAMCRKAHATTLIELDDGSCYGLIGGGYMSDGTSAQALREHDYNERVLADMEEILIHSLPEYLKKYGILCDNGKCLEVEMIGFDAGNYWYVEKNYHLFIQMRFDGKFFHTKVMSAEVMYNLCRNERGLHAKEHIGNWKRL